MTSHFLNEDFGEGFSPFNEDFGEGYSPGSTKPSMCTVLDNIFALIQNPTIGSGPGVDKRCELKQNNPLPEPEVLITINTASTIQWSNPHIWSNRPDWELQSFLDHKVGLTTLSSYIQDHVS